jgi:hypothetical protein
MPANGLEQRYRTLGELLTELKARLSFVAQGPASNNNNPVLTSFLQEGHDYLYAKLKPNPARKKTTIMLEPGSFLYDWHNDIEDEDIHPGRVKSVWVKLTDLERAQLRQGITEAHRADPIRTYPTRYDTLNGQCEVWPVPDQAYPLIVEYLAPKPRFAQPADRPGVNDRLILLYAIANGKAHYRHPDATAAATTFTNMLNIEMGEQHENKRYIVNEECQGDETVISSADGYKFRVR